MQGENPVKIDQNQLIKNGAAPGNYRILRYPVREPIDIVFRKRVDQRIRIYASDP